jgi:hypothetical protein
MPAHQVVARHRTITTFEHARALKKREQRRGRIDPDVEGRSSPSMTS